MKKNSNEIITTTSCPSRTWKVYRQPERLRIGRFVLFLPTRKGCIFIGKDDGESGDFSLRKFERAVAKFFEENF